MNLDLEAMKAAALAATPGEWHAPGLAELHDASNRVIACFSDVDPVIQEERPQPTIDEGDRNARFAALACPAAVLALIERLERAELLAKPEIDIIKGGDEALLIVTLPQNASDREAHAAAVQMHQQTGLPVIVSQHGASVVGVQKPDIKNDDLPTLRKRFSALYAIAWAKERHLEAVQLDLDALRASANPDALESERQANAMLTEENDRLQARLDKAEQRANRHSICFSRTIS